MYPQWQRIYAGCVLAVHAAILASALLLRCLTRNSRVFPKRDSLVQPVMFVGVALSMNYPIREVVGEASMPCLAYVVMGYGVSAFYGTPGILRILRLAAIQLAQARVARTLHPATAAPAPLVTPTRTLSHLRSSAPPSEASKADLPLPAGTEAGDTGAADNNEARLDAATTAWVRALPEGRTWGVRLTERVVLDWLAMHTTRSAALLLAASEVFVLSFAVARFATDPAMRPGFVGCMPSTLDDIASATGIAVIYACILLCFPAYWRHPDAWLLREEHLACLIATTLLLPFMIAPRVADTPAIIATLLPSQRAVMLVGWVHIIFAHCIPAIQALRIEARQNAAVAAADAMSAGVTSVAPSVRVPPPVRLRVPESDSMQRAVALSTPTDGIEMQAVVLPPAHADAPPDSAAVAIAPSSPPPLVTPAASPVAVVVSSNPLAFVGSGSGGGVVVVPVPRAAAAPQPVSPTATAATPSPATPAPTRHPNHSLLQFTMLCAAVGTEAVPVWQLPWATLMLVCQRVAAMAPSAMGEPEVRIVTAVMLGSVLRDKWLQPIMRQELAMEQLLLLQDCYAFRAYASSLTVLVHQMADAPAALPAPPTDDTLASIAEMAVVEWGGSARTRTSSSSGGSAHGGSGSGGGPRSGGGSGSSNGGGSGSDGAGWVGRPGARKLRRAVRLPNAAASRAPGVLAAVVAQSRQIQFRYLAPFSPMALALPPAAAAAVAAQIEAQRKHCNRLAAGLQLGGRGWAAADMDPILTEVRRTFDDVSRAVVAAIAGGPVLRLLNSAAAPALMADLRALLTSDAYMRPVGIAWG